MKGALPFAPSTFMMIVGAIEITAGILVLSRYTRYAAYIVAADGSTPRTIQWDWTGADRCCGTAVEYQPA